MNGWYTWDLRMAEIERARNVCINEKLWNKITERAKALGLSKSQVIRELIAKDLEVNKNETKQSERKGPEDCQGLD